MLYAIATVPIFINIKKSDYVQTNCFLADVIITYQHYTWIYVDLCSKGNQ